MTMLLRKNMLRKPHIIILLLGMALPAAALIPAREAREDDRAYAKWAEQKRVEIAAAESNRPAWFAQVRQQQELKTQQPPAPLRADVPPLRWEPLRLKRAAEASDGIAGDLSPRFPWRGFILWMLLSFGLLAYAVYLHRSSRIPDE